MSKIFFGISWAGVEYALLFPFLILALWLVLYRFNKVRRVIKQLAGTWLSLLVHNFSVQRHVIKCILMSVGLFSLFLALLRPQWYKSEQIVAQKGRDLFIALDVSRSMLATDCSPNRLACAKEKIKHLVQELSCERVGLILFSGSAFVQCPLTTDYQAFRMFLDHVDAETISSGTTAMDAAIKQVLHAYKAMPAKKNKLLVIFTDGEDFSSNLDQFKREAQKEALHIFALGIGTPEGAPIPLFDQLGNPAGHQRDNKGNVVISRLNEGILSTLANDVGGSYIRFSPDDSDVRGIVRSVQSFQKEHIEDKKFAQLQEQYPYFLIVSFFCFALEWLL